jgi:phosphoserine aminotransferase
MSNPSLEEPFLQFVKEQGIVGIKGHRLVGGFRASLYNALPLQSVEFLTTLIKDFTSKHA